jgi:hypothetical protein
MTNAEVAASWRAEAVSTLAWRRARDQSGSGGGILKGYAVEAAGFPRRGYLKPGERLPAAARAKCYAAREKIAADLAYDLGLAVPPATLCRVKDDWGDPEPCAVVTLFLYPFQLDWTDVVFENLRPPNMSDEDVAKVLAQATGAFAFDTWLDQADHAEAHPGNIVWGYNPVGGSELVFLDYASSMGADASWNDEGWFTVALAPFPRFLLDRLDLGLLEQTLTKIETFSEASIQEVVERVPTNFLHLSEKSMLQAALIGRRRPVVNMLRDRFLRG